MLSRSFDLLLESFIGHGLPGGPFRAGDDAVYQMDQDPPLLSRGTRPSYPVDVRTQNDLFGTVRLMIAAESSPVQNGGDARGREDLG